MERLFDNNDAIEKWLLFKSSPEKGRIFVEDHMPSGFLYEGGLEEGYGIYLRLYRLALV